MALALRLPLFIAIIAVGTGLPQLQPQALATGLDAEGKATLKEATGLYKQGQYEEAAKLLTGLAVDHPEMANLQRNLGACYYYLHRPEPALSNLRDYLAHKKSDIAAEDKAEVERWIGEMEKLRSRNASTLVAPPTAESPPAPQPNGESPPVSPPNEMQVVTSPAPNPPASQPPRTSAPSSPAQPDVPPKKTSEVLAGNTPAPTAESLATPAAPAGPVPPATTVSGVAGIVSAGVGVGTLATGIILGLIAHNRNQSALDRCPQAPCNDSAKALQSEAKDYAMGANIAFIAGGTLLLSGVTLYLLAPTEKPTQQNQARLWLFGGPSLLGLATRGTW